MKTKIIWEEKLMQSVHSIALNPQGNVLIAAVGSSVLVYDAKTGSKLYTLQGHLDNIYSVSFSWDGVHFASGGSDKSVIIWKSDHGKGLYKYTHCESIQVVAFCPLGGVDSEHFLASCASTDFMIWSSNGKDLCKHQIDSKVMSAVWTKDGQSIALGHYSGLVSIRDRTGNELARFTRNSPICSLYWMDIHAISDKLFKIPEELLMVGSWDKSISFYHRSGCQHEYREQLLSFFPLSISQLGSSTNLVMVGGTKKDMVIFSSLGCPVYNFHYGDDAWIWSMDKNSFNNIIISGSNNGHLCVSKVEIVKAESMHGGIYVYCGADLTEICVYDFSTGLNLTIPCNSIIRSLSISNEFILALLTNSKVSIFSLIKRNGLLSYEFIRMVTATHDSICVSALSSSMIINDLSKLLVKDFDGKLLSEASFQNNEITFVKPVLKGGDEDFILVAFDNGIIRKHFVSYPSENSSLILKHSSSIRFVDINMRKDLTAIIDKDDYLFIFEEQGTGVPYFKRDSITRFLFSENNADMSCFCDGCIVHVLFYQHVIYSLDICTIKREPINLTGPNLSFCSDGNIYSVRMSFSAAVRQLIKGKCFSHALELGYLGLPKNDWDFLGLSAIRNFKLDIAKKCFAVTQKSWYVVLINDLELQLEKCSNDDEIDKAKNSFLGEVAVYNNDFDVAIELFDAAGNYDKVIDIYVSSRRWDDAIKYAKKCRIFDERAILIRKAKWLVEEKDDWMMASKLYFSCGYYVEAIKAVTGSQCENAELTKMSLIEFARSLPKSEKIALKECINYFEIKDEHELITEVLVKLGNVPDIMKHYIKLSDWDAASLLFYERHHELDKISIKLYAEGLVFQNKFYEAIDVYRRGEMTDQTVELLKVLADNAVIETRFKDASHLFWLLFVEQSKSLKESSIQSGQTLLLAKIYYAYQNVHDYCSQPFTNINSDVIFHTAYYITSMIGRGNGLHGVSLVNVLYALAKQAKKNRAFKTARTVYRYIQNFRIPEKWREVISMDTLKIQASPNEDDADLGTVCVRCGASLCLFAIFNKQSKPEACLSCGHPFTRCFLSFDILPLVEFCVEETLTDDEAIRLIKEPKPNSMDSRYTFEEMINQSIENQIDPDAYETMIIDARTLINLNRSEIFMCKPLQDFEKTRFFKNMIPEISIVMSSACNLFFHEEEFDFFYLREQHCPFSRAELSSWSHL